MSNILNSALDFLGLSDSEDETEYLDEEIKPSTRKNKVVSMGYEASQPIVIHLMPNAFEDVRDIADHLQNKMIVTINLTLVDVSISKRIIDFASGAVYALDGGIIKLAEDVYLLTAQGVTLQERGHVTYNGFTGTVGF
jgi:Uncharacterized protein conserved in bacteria